MRSSLDDENAVSDEVRISSLSGGGELYMVVWEAQRRGGGDRGVGGKKRISSINRVLFFFLLLFLLMRFLLKAVIQLSLVVWQRTGGRNSIY